MSQSWFNNNNNDNPPIFELQRKLSTKFLSSHTTSIPCHYTPLKEIQSELDTITSPDLLPLIHHFRNTTDQIQGFFSGLGGPLQEALDTLIPLFKFSSNIEAITAPDTFMRLMARVFLSCSDDSLDSVASNAGATLRELHCLARNLDDDLENARLSARGCNAIFSTFVTAVAAVFSPLTVIAFGPCLQSIDPLWNYAMENPIKEKQKLVETMLFITHSAVVKVGEIKDQVRTLAILVAELKVGDGDVLRRFPQVEKAVVDVLKEVKLAALEFA